MTDLLKTERYWVRRRDGANAIVCSFAKGLVLYRRHDDGELLRLRADAFLREYEVLHG